MKNPKFWVAVLAAGVVANIIDMVVMGMMLAPTFASIPSMRQGVNPVWYVIGDFLAVFVFTLVYDRVHSSFAAGPLGGATFGAYAGLLVSFPTWIFIHLMVVDFPIGLACGLTAYGILWGVVVGYVIGALLKK